MNSKIVVTFSSSHQALRAEECFLNEKIDFELIPTPREISAECGFALLIYNSEADRLYNICRKNKVNIDGIYLITNYKGEKKYEKSD